ncbi:AarF/UbiB family protein [Mucilaginibacter sp. SMC90]|uniref:lanthionine synthetase LanC family protein n=1 Tax=Mucilaginibacter sp. SMC90 TaxID=2929803 RepID=UPI001FB2C18F|nr:lanthionine synthetase LanC family protein [Mucilaginibacter sp. SMC90]UOE47847.1 AarF/UbiB family protein [Mucilaginibacter sp. SMC90]
MDAKTLKEEPLLPAGPQAIEPVSQTNNEVGEYQKHLVACQFDFVVNYPYLSVMKTDAFEGWALHVTVVVPQTEKMLVALFPVLKRNGISFDIPFDKAAHYSLLTGRQGQSTHAKIINLYPGDEIQARHLAVQLIEITTDFAGPNIPGALKLGNCLFTSHIPVNLGHANPHQQHLTKVTIKSGVSTSPWPFRNLKVIKKKDNPKIIRKYVLSEIIKDDAKGKVFKAIKLSWTLNPATYLIKQGLHAQSYDDHHRDIRNRLLWQFRVHQVLQSQLSIPKVFDYFELDGDGYLVMEYIEGKNLNKTVELLYGGKRFATADIETRETIIKLARQVIFIVEKLHSLNYVHRDLNPQNFLINTSGELFLTDFELSASLSMQEPNPPFGVGTSGYMPQGQFQGNQPSVRDDFYAVSGILIKLFTGCSPLKFENSDRLTLETQLLFFINDSALVKGIASLRLTECESDLRGSLPVLFDAANDPCIIELKAMPAADALQVIYKGLNIFKSGLFKPETDIESATTYSLSSGLSGILLCLAAARKANLITRESANFGDDLYRKLSNDYLGKSFDKPTCLFNGNGGVALTIAALLDCGMITTDHVSPSQLALLFLSHPAQGNDLATGKAGFGMALLKCLPFMEPGIASRLLADIVNYLETTQNTDGSWPLFHGHGNDLPPGLFYGISGILCFLIEYRKTYEVKTVDQLLRKGLHYLLSHKEFILLTSGGKPEPGAAELFGVGNGIPGIAFMLMRAYAYSGENNIKDTIYQLLEPFPDFPTTDYLGFENGLAGLGQVYLEAYRVFGDDCWQLRADAIAGFLFYTGSNYEKNSRYWMTVNGPDIIHGFLRGQAGVLHFLIRYLKPDHVKFPIV